MIKLFPYIILLCLFPQISLGAEFRLQPSALSVVVGETVEVYVQVNTTDKANAVSGQILFDETSFQLERIEDGNSIIALWVEQPRERERGIVTFSGIVPGGFTGSGQTLFNLRLKALRDSETAISASSLRVLAHDGNGTDLSVVYRPVMITIESGIPGVTTEVIDREPPEYFTPAIIPRDSSSDTPIEIIFSTVDKGVGGVQYYIREYRHPWFRFMSPWIRVESPYRVPAGTEQYYREIKAVDSVGNERVVELVPTETTSFMIIFVLVLLLICACACSYCVFRRYKKVHD